MPYISTRGDHNAVNAKTAIKRGTAPDGGLYVDPNISQHQLFAPMMAATSYQAMARIVLAALLPDYTADELSAAVSAAYSNTFDDPAITPVRDVDGLHILELFHGPTSAFKDIGLQLLPHIMAQALNPHEDVLVLAATSGDTGKAALAGFQDVPHTRITTFYPDGGVSPIQERQMLTAGGLNTTVAAIQGNFDDAQTAVKQILNDRQLAATLQQSGSSVTAANSINVGRLIPQVVYYFAAYRQLVERDVIRAGELINFTVPTGNFGDVLAGYYAKMMGLPVAKFVVATNANSVVADFLQTGRYDRNRPFLKTVAPSMDIQVSSNLERLLYYKSGGDTDLVARLMADLDRDGAYTVNPELLTSLQDDFVAASADDEAVEDAIRDAYQQHGYLMDPHTAAGYAAQQSLAGNLSGVTVLLSTASPYKFPRAVAAAVAPELHGDDFDLMRQLAAKTGVPNPNNLGHLDRLPARVPVRLTPDAMPAFVEQQALQNKHQSQEVGL